MANKKSDVKRIMRRARQCQIGSFGAKDPQTSIIPPLPISGLDLMDYRTWRGETVQMHPPHTREELAQFLDEASAKVAADCGKATTHPYLWHQIYNGELGKWQDRKEFFDWRDSR